MLCFSSFEIDMFSRSLQIFVLSTNQLQRELNRKYPIRKNDSSETVGKRHLV